MATVTLLLGAAVFYNWRVTECIIFCLSNTISLTSSRISTYYWQRGTPRLWSDCLEHIVCYLATWGWSQSFLDVDLVDKSNASHIYCCLTSQWKPQKFNSVHRWLLFLNEKWKANIYKMEIPRNKPQCLIRGFWLKPREIIYLLILAERQPWKNFFFSQILSIWISLLDGQM